MKYFIIAGEASGDLHAANLMQSLKNEDKDASFRFFGGDQMSKVGGIRLYHYKQLAYMGFIPVLTHLPQILAGMVRCKKNINRWKPDAVILVDYPGFNLKIAKYIHRHCICPVFYYISPKVWAWKERRIKAIEQCVDTVFSILPFEVGFYKDRSSVEIDYVGNPTLDEVDNFKRSNEETFDDFTADAGLDKGKPIIALLAGSRIQEIRNNLPLMCRAAAKFTSKGYQTVLGCAPAISNKIYEEVLAPLKKAGIATPALVHGMTYRLLSHSTAALVTSGTATLETALFGVPQIVCYYISFGRLVSALRKMFLKVPYISLVNLICNKEVVPELVADGMTEKKLCHCLHEILPNGNTRETMLEEYKKMREILGGKIAPTETAKHIISSISKWQKRQNETRQEE